MLRFEDPLFQRYAKFVGISEGGLSKDPDDPAASQVQPGQYHTNMGVTFNTFKSYAKSLGVLPAYSTFIGLTKGQADRILYAYYQDAAKGINDPITGLILTNIKWGSGNVLGHHTRAALNKIGVKVNAVGNLDDSIRRTINEQNTVKFNQALMQARREFLESLAKRRAKSQKYLKGWLNREDRFKAEFIEKKNFNEFPWFLLMIGGALFLSSK